jgi:hypothetical protein
VNYQPVEDESCDSSANDSKSLGAVDDLVSDILIMRFFNIFVFNSSVI